MIEFYHLDTEVEIGHQLVGKCLWKPCEQEGKKPLKLTIFWRTEGRGTVEKEVIYTTKVKPLEEVDFACQIPVAGPVSYEGSLLRIIWEIVITRQGFFEPKTLTSKAFRVIPRQLN